MKIETGEPPAEGRYVVFIESAANGWLAPAICSWFQGRWDMRCKVFGWSGPIPVIKTVDLQVFDL